MLKHALACTALVASIFGKPIIASADEFGTAEEAKAMLDRAIAAVEADEPGAIAMFNHNDSRFRDRDLFVFCFNAQDGKFTAHEAMVTQDVRTLRDKTGNPFGEQMYLKPKQGQITTVAYMSPVPGSTEQAIKRAYLTRVGDQVCGVSAYQFELTPKLSTALKERVATETFFMSLTLSSLTGPQVLFVSQPKPWKNELACVHALPRMEGAVSRLIQYDASALDLFGTTTGHPLKPGYFVSEAECSRSAEPGP